MRIAFICGSLEPGRSGVGDYAVSLAAECVRRGRPCRALSLNDRHVSEPAVSEISGVEILRLPGSLPWEERIARALASIQAMNADWVSFQMSCYGFNDKGIIAGLAKRFRRLSAGRNAHLMFHELWIGLPESSGWKDRVVGGIQKFFILDFLRQIRPRVVHTNTAAYRALLDKCGVRSTVLPLFSAIPIVPVGGSEWPLEELASRGIPIGRGNRGEYWIFGMFGSIPPEWKPEPLFGCLSEAASARGRKLVVTATGNMDPGSLRSWEAFARDFAGRAAFHHFGGRSPEQVSEIFNTLDFGIATSSWAVIGKSSSAAAMRDHGLPVIVTRDDVTFRGCSFPEDAAEGLLKLDATLPQKLAAAARRPAHAGLADVAGRFLHDLEGAM